MGGSLRNHRKVETANWKETRMLKIVMSDTERIRGNTEVIRRKIRDKNLDIRRKHLVEVIIGKPQARSHNMQIIIGEAHMGRPKLGKSKPETLYLSTQKQSHR